MSMRVMKYERSNALWCQPCQLSSAMRACSEWAGMQTLPLEEQKSLIVSPSLETRKLSSPPPPIQEAQPSLALKVHYYSTIEIIITTSFRKGIASNSIDRSPSTSLMMLPDLPKRLNQTIWGKNYGKNLLIKESWLACINEKSSYKQRIHLLLKAKPYQPYAKLMALDQKREGKTGNSILSYINGRQKDNRALS